MEYKFRGKANNEWYYGDLIIANDTNKSRHYYIIADEYSDEDSNIPNTIELDTCNSPEVTPETIGQYTGLHDKNKKEIYEGDIIEITRPCILEIGIVKFINGCFVIKSKDTLLMLYQCEINDFKLEVIGNIYDNKNLLEG